MLDRLSLSTWGALHHSEPLLHLVSVWIKSENLQEQFNFLFHNPFSACSFIDLLVLFISIEVILGPVHNLLSDFMFVRVVRDT